MAVSVSHVGFDCEFVEDPPQWLQTECPICLQVLQEPYQVTCCGKSFCKQCIERIKAANKACPCCKKEDFNDFPNKGLQQPLYGFKVYCINKEKGCEWKGELGDLEKHINLNPQSNEDKEQDGCEFAEINCSYCSDSILRSKLLHHQHELCDKRPFSCEYCCKYESTYEDVIHNHWPVCGYHPVRCPNQCDAFPQRKELDGHVQNECPLTEVVCDFQYAGCEMKLHRKSMPDHLKNGLITHLSLLAVSHKWQQEVHREEIKLLSKKYQEDIEDLERRHQDEIKALTEEMNELKMQTNMLRLHVLLVPVDFTVEGPHAHTDWYSTPFYSHSRGYKLRLRFHKYTIRCYLLLGEFDSFLKWPVKAVMKIAIPYQQSQDESYLYIELNLKRPIVDDDFAPDMRSCGCNAIVTDLSPYLRNNCLYLRVDTVQF